MRPGSLSRATRHGIIWATGTFVAGRAITFLSVIVLARLLEPADFGVVAAIVVFLSLLELTSDVGMQATVVYEQERGITDRVQTALSVNVLIALVLAGAGVLAAPLVAGFFGMEEEAWLFRLASLSLLITGLSNVHDSVLMRELAFGRRVFPQIARALVRGVVSIALALGGLGAEALVIGMLAGSATWTVIQWALTPLRPRLTLDLGIARSMVGYASGAFALQVLAVVGTRLDTAVVGRVLGAQALGLYTVASRIPELLIESVAWNVSQVAFPALSRKRVTDPRGLAGATLKLFRYQALYAVPVAAGLALLAPPLVVVLFSDAWREAGGVMSAAAVMMGISAIVFPLGDVFKALGRQRLYVVLMLVQFPVFVAAIVWAAPHGILAVAWARAAVGLLHAVLVTGTVARTVRLGAFDLAAAAAPAAVTGLGVIAGAGAVRLAWPALSVWPLLLGGALGAVGGLAALRLLASGAYREVRSIIADRPRLAGART